jgi:CheY-like chemotaxis protein
MFSRVAIFEDKVKDQKALQSMLEARGCETILVKHARPSEDKERILAFQPELCIIDSMFTGGTEIDGIDIVRFCHENMPEVPLVVCTVLLTDKSKRDWICRRYENLPGVRAVFSKDPLPTVEEIIAACSA